MTALLSLAIGLGIFLFGMHQLEKSLEKLAGPRINDILGRSTRHPLSSVLSGTVITAILQSSSMVSLIVLAFASAGIIPLFNAVGVILGANLGTTFTGWIVATIGFKMDLESFALPLFGLSALVSVFAPKHSSLRTVSLATLGLGLLLFGLNGMKDAVNDLPGQIDHQWLGELSHFSFLLLGIVLTAVIQSSSAMVLIALSALGGGIIDLQGAAALVVGADLGTTSTTALGALKSPPVAKQLALSHVIYNLTVDSLAFFILIPILPWALLTLGIEDPFYGLVLFHSAFNFIGLLIFVPILKPFSHWLGSFFNIKERPVTTYIHQTPATVRKAAVSSLQQELELMLTKVLALNLRNLKFKQEDLSLPSAQWEKIEDLFPPSISFDERYLEIKKLEGELHSYCANIQKFHNGERLVIEIRNILQCARAAVYSAKTLKDIRQDLVYFRHHKQSPQELELPQEALHIYVSFADLVFNTHKTRFVLGKLDQLKTQNETLHDKLHKVILGAMEQNNQPYERLASLLNVNRELWHANVNLIEAFRLRSSLHSND